jgi:type VII secretion protein EccB
MAMQSRRDLYHAHRLMTQRASLALLRGEPDVPDQPMRRLNVGTFAGILVAVIVAGIFGIWGLLFHGGTSLQDQPGTLIIDKQTGTNYVFCEKGKDICPVVNYASALLALQTTSVTVQTPSQSSLTTIPHGPLLGIPGLPPDLPGAGLLIRQPWSACTQNSFGVAGVSGGETNKTILSGGIQTGGQPIGTGLLLVRSPGQDWVIGDGLRMPIAPTTLADLFSASQPVPVPSAWLNALPQGGAFQAPAIAGQFTTVTGPAGTQVQVGALFKTVEGATTQYYVTLQNGSLASVTQTQESLLALEPGDLPPNTSSPPILNPSDLSGHVSGALPDNGLPATDTNPVSPSPSTPLCVVFSGSGPSLTAQVETGGQVPLNGTPTGAPAGSDLVDQVALPPEKGALVREVGSSISYILVTDGHRYALASTSVPGFLGYSLSQAVQLPAGLVDMIPPGPGFNPAQAADPVASGG